MSHLVTSDKTHFEHKESAVTLKVDLIKDIVDFGFVPRNGL